MANLETLELTINANAASASQGLTNLISSLSSLSSKVGKAVGGLKLLNKELATLKKVGNIKIPAITGGTGSGSKASPLTNTKQQIKNMNYQATAATKLAIAMQNMWAKSKGVYIGKNDNFKSFNPLTGQFDLEPERGAKKFSSDLPKAAEALKSINKQASDSPSRFEKLKSGFKNLGKELKDTVPKFHALHRIMRIASTMLIRMGIRALFNGIKEGLSNYYQYSKGINGAFAQAADNLSSVWATLKNQMGAAIAPALTAAIPVINSLASAATTAFNALSQLFALLTGQGSWSKATAQVNAFDAAAQKAGGGGGGLNEMLAKFDELNVIASESGGGGGAAAAAEEYATMFEEMYEFDEKIRNLANFIKDTTDWVKDNFDVVLKTIELIGVAILGWKISTAFEGALSTIGSLIAGGALITLGVVLELDFGKKIGSSLAGGDSLNAGDIVEGVAGMIASAIGGYVIAGAVGASGGVGAAIGLGISIVAMITGVAVGWKEKSEAKKWGKVTLTVDEISDYVKKQFGFDVDAEIKVVSAEITNVRTAKAHLNGAISEFSRKIDKIEINVDDSQVAIDNAIASSKTVIDALDKYLESSKNLLHKVFEINPSEVSKQIKTDVDEADKQISSYIEGEGKKIADLYDQGMKSGWKNNEQEQILSLLQHLEGIFKAAEADQAYNEFIATSKLKLKDMTKTTAEAILEEQKKTLNAYEKALSDATKEAVESLLYRAKLAEEAGLPKVAEGLRKDAQTLIDSFTSESKKKLDAAKETMKNDWSKSLQEIYAGDYRKVILDNITKQWRDDLAHNLKTNEEDAKKQLQDLLYKVTQVNKVTKEATELFGITGWELLDEHAKKRFFDAIYNAVGVEGIKLLKDAINISAVELITISGWDKLQEKQQLAFLKALSNAYGASETLKAAKEAGINVADAINKGLGSKDKDTKETAKALAKDIQDTLDAYGIKINAEADIDVAVNAIIEYEVKNTSNNAKAASVTTSLVASKPAIASKYHSLLDAEGDYNIPRGQVFIAQEKGAELVGNINGKTSVANQQQIIDGIASGVERANSEQNILLRQQNELLRGILEKDNSVRLSASAALGRVARQSLDMYGSMVGG